MPNCLFTMASGTVPCLACWPCVELLRQYELLRVRSHYEDLCGSFIHREFQRARSLVYGKEGTFQQNGDCSGGSAPILRNSAASQNRLDSYRVLTPRESFNRWLMERRSVPARHADPLIPSIQHSVNDDKPVGKLAGLSSRDDERVNVFSEVTSSLSYAAELTRSGKKDSKADTELDKKTRREGGSYDESAETNVLQCSGAITLPSFDHSSTATLEREILEDVPLKVTISPTAAKSRKYLADYARAVGSIMLEEKQKVEQVSLAALSPLVDALLMLLRGERGVSAYDREVLTGPSSATIKRGTSDLLVALSSELHQQQRKWGSLGRQCDGDTQREPQELGTSSRAKGSFRSKQDLPEQLGEDTANFCNENLCYFEPPDAIFRGKAAAGEHVSHSGTESIYNTLFCRSANHAFAKGPFGSASNEVARSRSLATDFVRKSFGTSECSFSKDDVYYTVCLARPVLKAIYGDEVRALVKNVEEVAQQAAARVAQYAACLAVEHAAEGECSTHYSDAPGFNTVQGMNIHSPVQNVNAGTAALPPTLHSKQGGPYVEAPDAPAGTRNLIGDIHPQKGEAAARTTVLDRRETVISGGRALLLNTRAARRHSVTRAVEDKDLSHTLKDFPSQQANASDGYFVVNNIRWVSCRGCECFIYIGDVEMLAWDHCEAVRTDIFRSFRSRYSLKGYKVAELWARFISKKLGQKDENLVRGDCMRMECVCRGRGWCAGEWTCSCVRRQIKRIQRSPYAGEFTIMLFCLLCRYYSVCGCRKQGKGLHSAAPGGLMQVLREQLGVECELFASPFNVSLNTYCSLFPDIDAFFGSEGSFFDPNFTVKEGSYEANPPFEEFVMSRFVSRIEHWLDISAKERGETEGQRPLSFCVLVPYWPAGPSQYMYALTRSKYMRFSFVIPEGQHYFLSGFQHFCPRKDVARIAVCKTLFAVLQNEAGAQKWPVTPEIAERIKASWKSDTTFSRGKGGSF